MQLAKDYKRTFNPRYVTFLYGSQKLYFSDLKVFLAGTSPGTYNSRTAFYLNGDFLQNKFIRNNFSYRTTYHENYVFPLLNRKLLQTKRWNDGTRNQPFSSFVSILLEYGFIVGVLFFYIQYKKMKQIRAQTKITEMKRYLSFLTIFLFILLLCQNYFEYPEIIVFFVITYKLVDIDNARKNSIIVEE